MKNKAAQTLGRRGGQKTAKRGKSYYSLIGKQGAAKRWRGNDSKIRSFEDSTDTSPKE